ncbi:MAG TPA: serine/threonine-protein kinase [Gemmataceae bacterium]|nr:serine/threonine-protein kinase [Gemmataceae bacterium]
MSRIDCPPVGNWQALLEGDRSECEIEGLAHHLETCGDCRQTLESLAVAPAVWEDTARSLGEQRRKGSQEPALRDVVERLKDEELSTPEADLSFLQPTDAPNLLGLLGSYQVQEEIGRGGMGVVFKAVDPDLNRIVAIKVLSPWLASNATARRRFIREAKAAAAVCHDHIVTVHAVSEADGLPYLVMQYVAGESLQARLNREGPLEAAEVVRIGLQTASGLAAAHAQGLIHRDIKPANLLLENGSDRVKITDFGLARMADDVALTQDGVIAGTPEYMAPEQARGESVDHRADLFSLGSVLYAMCTGSPPFYGSTALAVLRQINDEEPVSIRSLNPNVPAWLEAFIVRLMAKDPAQRFHSAAEAAALLKGYITHLRQPDLSALQLPSHSVSDRPKLVPGDCVAWGFRRHSRITALLFLMTLGLIASGLLLVGGGLIPLAQPTNDPASPPELPGDAIDEGVWTLTFSPDSKRLVTAGGDHSRPGQLQIWDLASNKPLVTRRASQGVRSTAWSPDGSILATGHWGGNIKLRDPLSGQERTTLTGHQMGVNGLAFSADSALLASAGLDKTARLWDLKTLHERQTLLGHSDMVFSVAFFRHGQAIVTGSNDQTARIWNLGSGEQRFVLRGHRGAIESVAISPDDKVVATGGGDRTIRLWDAETGKETAVLRQKGGYVQSLSFSPNGLLLASAGSDGTIHLWEVASRKLLKSIRQHDGIARVVAFSPDGKLMASGGGQDKTAKLWDVTTAKNETTFSATGAVAVPDTSEDIELQTSSKGRWLRAAGLLFAVFTLSSFGVWYLLRRRANTLPSTAPAQDKKTVPISVSPVLTVQCSGCNKRLKVKPELAGKKVKCPQCGTAAVVPHIAPGLPGAI